MKNSIFCLSLVLAATGCRTSRPGPLQASAKRAAGPEMSNAMNRLRSLEGAWSGTMPEYNNQPVKSVFTVTSSGSVVREIMAPGDQHEMTNMYHLDGDRIVVTHYCGLGNQPRMAAVSEAPKSIAFEFESITNFTTGDAGFMGRLEIEFIDKDHIIQHWTHYKSGAATGVATFDLRREQHAEGGAPFIYQIF